MFDVIPIPALRDNYIWLLQHEDHAVVVDPGDAGPVLDELQARKLKLDAILITHHHHDHIDGVPQLLSLHPAAAVYAPAKENYAFPHHAVGEDDIVTLPTIGAQFRVMETPGHTLGHVVYYGANSLLCGDTLFSCGCGRLFEGTCEQLYQSLQRLAALPSQTRIYCTHEYTEHNIRFALSVEPTNSDLHHRQAEVQQRRNHNQPSLPSTIATELATNPFLRCDSTILQSTMGTHNPVTTFCALRESRNSF